jgi:hypothetical protein
MEIRICNDGGRLTRPLLKVRDNKAIITSEIISRVESHELSWNDLLTSCNIDESVIEYIDPEEQNFAMVAMKTKHGYLGEGTYNYSHCEIHPSTIFGVLASCIPFPEHNQAPRNTYQCLGLNELVWMADGTKKPICDVKIGDNVLTFQPETMEVSTTTVVNHFVRKNEYPIYRLKTISGREITATEDHKFMTNQGWATVKELIENPELYIGISMQQTNDISHVEIDDNILIMNEDMFIEKMRNIGIDETSNRKISKILQYAQELKNIGLLPLYTNNKKMALLSRIIGFLYADGSLNIYNKNSHNYSYKYKNLQ